MKYQYFNSHVLLVINGQGAIRRLYTPFRVLEVDTGIMVYIDEIVTNDKDELIFMVNNQPHPYHRFRITILF